MFIDAMVRKAIDKMKGGVEIGFNGTKYRTKNTGGARKKDT
jgi:hypothetical protein